VSGLMDQDKDMMLKALLLAEKGLGNVAPNPSVGCIIVKDGQIVGQGWTQKGGRPHAETVALDEAGNKAKGATVYVTFEPCSHHGQTPPCAEALIAAGVSRVVVAISDPDERVSGSGITMLREAGLDVDEGLCADEALWLNNGFIKCKTEQRPHFTLKIASSLDGHIATSSGESKWITGEASRAAGHMLRATHDAILVGIETVIDDDPRLDCRLEDCGDRSPVRIILDSRARLPLDSELVKTANEFQTILVTSAASSPNALLLAEEGVLILPVLDTRNMQHVASAIAASGLTRVLVEGGAKIHSSFIRAKMADSIEWFRSGIILGANSKAAIGDFGQLDLDGAPHFNHVKSEALGSDRHDSYIMS
jgi:diaminohydroxyphosphoribosylaminopyrimidine deaminase / 5-amino-6-(5-phosphoribosylamino)uracil reductase